jgi:hypothetical protein
MPISGEPGAVKVARRVRRGGPRKCATKRETGMGETTWSVAPPVVQAVGVSLGRSCRQMLVGGEKAGPER